jgi:hypothetical protein
MGIAVGGAIFGLFAHCTAEDLVYQPTSKKDASVDGKAGDGAVGVGGKPGWAEICGNGIDDNSDGKTDCEDPNCENYACVTLPPSGWQGPVAVFQGDAGELPQCPKGLSEVYNGHTALTFEPTDCSAGCSCSAPTSTSCSGQLVFHSAGGCASGVNTITLTPGSSCGGTFVGIVGSVQITTTASGNCGAGTPPAGQKASATWTTDVRACALQADAGKQAGCGSGKVCAPATSEALACVYQAGDLDCPTGYDTRYVSYTGQNDTRSCGACGCTFAADDCVIPVNGFSITDCTSQTVTAGTSGCYDGDVHAITTGSGSINNARCDPGTSSPSGCVAPDSPTTICCAGGTNPCPSGGGPRMVPVSATDGPSYCIDSTEVTKKQYADFLATTPSTTGQPANCTWNLSFVPTAGFPPATGDENKPVGYVDWCDAIAFCAWAGKRLCGKIGGGPLTMAAATQSDLSQWDNACSAGGNQSYPYGDSFVDGACNTGSVSDVKASPCCQGGVPGVYDLVGNAIEWEDACDAKSPNIESQQCASRGGSDCDSIDTHGRKEKLANLGFRCCSP